MSSPFGSKGPSSKLILDHLMKASPEVKKMPLSPGPMRVPTEVEAKMLDISTTAALGDFEKALDGYKRLLLEQKDHLSDKLRIEIYYKMGELWIAENNRKRTLGEDPGRVYFEEAKKCYQYALEISVLIGSRSGATAALHALRAIAQTLADPVEEISYSADLYDWQQGVLDYKAKRVEQGEIGFSSMQPMGTDNIQQCIAIVVHDTKTHFTALAHFDLARDPKYISDQLLKFMYRGNRLVVKLVGAGINDRSIFTTLDRLPSDPARISYLQGLLKTHGHDNDVVSAKNMLYLINVLHDLIQEGYLIDIAEGGLAEVTGGRTTAIVVHPADAKIEADRVACEDRSQERWLRHGLLYHPSMNNSPSGLRFRMAFVENHEMNICLDQKQIDSIFKSSPFLDFLPLPPHNALFVAIKKRVDYDNPAATPEWKAMVIKAKAAPIIALHKACSEISEFYPCKYKVLKQIYLGEGALEKNAELAKNGNLFTDPKMNMLFYARYSAKKQQQPPLAAAAAAPPPAPGPIPEKKEEGHSPKKTRHFEHKAEGDEDKIEDKAQHQAEQRENWHQIAAVVQQARRGEAASAAAFTPEEENKLFQERAEKATEWISQMEGWLSDLFPFYSSGGAKDTKAAEPYLRVMNQVSSHLDARPPKNIDSLLFERLQEKRKELEEQCKAKAESAAGGPSGSEGLGPKLSGSK